jgi:hypothetical protein
MHGEPWIWLFILGGGSAGGAFVGGAGGVLVGWWLCVRTIRRAMRGEERR